jgi:hypothetical protein
MKLVFFSSDRVEVEHVGQALADAGIHCKIRPGGEARASVNQEDAELWVLNDHDCSRAFLLCVESGVGFGKPKVPPGGINGEKSAMLQLPLELKLAHEPGYDARARWS